MTVKTTEVPQQSQDDMDTEETTQNQQLPPYGSQQKKQPKKKKRRRKLIPMPKDIAEDEELHKYWNQRYRLFSKFDDGVKLDRGKYFFGRARL